MRKAKEQGADLVAGTHMGQMGLVCPQLKLRDTMETLLNLLNSHNTQFGGLLIRESQHLGLKYSKRYKILHPAPFNDFQCRNVCFWQWDVIERSSTFLSRIRCLLKLEQLACYCCWFAIQQHPEAITVDWVYAPGTYCKMLIFCGSVKAPVYSCCMLFLLHATIR